MIGLLTDPWFGAHFIGKTNAQGHLHFNTIEGVDGVFLWCPCAYGDDAKAHGLIISFANPKTGLCPSAGGSRHPDGTPARWMMSGTGLHDLTLSPSVVVGTCWHGFIVNGEVR